MSGLLQTSRTQALQWLLTTTALTRPTSWYVSLHKTTLDVSNPSASEFTTTDFASYARQSSTFSVTNDDATNAAQIQWNVDSGAPTTSVVAVAIWDALSAGNCIGYALANLSAIGGSPLTIAVGNLDIQLVATP